MTDFCSMTATALVAGIKNGDFSPVEVMDASIRRIEAVDKAINAMVTRDFDRAIDRAKDVEAKRLKGEDIGILAGLPIGIKDLEASADMKTTYGSLPFKDHIPDQDDLSVANVKASGGIVIGKTNTPEHGAGGNTWNDVFGITANPFDTDKTSSGSSGGSAAALAAGMVPLASGSDFGGSLRTPASFCGIVGFRPSPAVFQMWIRPWDLRPLPCLALWPDMLPMPCCCFMRNHRLIPVIHFLMQLGRIYRYRFNRLI